jgi:hypothetical protein
MNRLALASLVAFLALASARAQLDPNLAAAANAALAPSKPTVPLLMTAFDIDSKRYFVSDEPGARRLREAGLTTVTFDANGFDPTADDAAVLAQAKARGMNVAVWVVPLQHAPLGNPADPRDRSPAFFQAMLEESTRWQKWAGAFATAGVECKWVLLNFEKFGPNRTEEEYDAVCTLVRDTIRDSFPGATVVTYQNRLFWPRVDADAAGGELYTPEEASRERGWLQLDAADASRRGLPLVPWVSTHCGYSGPTWIASWDYAPALDAERIEFALTLKPTAIVLYVERDGDPATPGQQWATPRLTTETAVHLAAAVEGAR